MCVQCQASLVRLGTLRQSVKARLQKGKQGLGRPRSGTEGRTIELERKGFLSSVISAAPVWFAKGGKVRKKTTHKWHQTRYQLVDSTESSWPQDFLVFNFAMEGEASKSKKLNFAVVGIISLDKSRIASARWIHPARFILLSPRMSQS